MTDTTYLPKTDPASKADLINRLLASNGDLHTVFKDGRVAFKRVSAQAVELVTAAGRRFILAVHMPKSEKAREAAKVAFQKRMAKAVPNESRKGVSTRRRAA